MECEDSRYRRDERLCGKKRVERIGKIEERAS